MAGRKISSGEAVELKIGFADSDCWKVYRGSAIGRSLLDALGTMQSLSMIDREMSETVLVLFDVAVRRWMARETNLAGGNARLWADKVVAFRHVDRQLKIVLKEAKLYMMVETEDAKEFWAELKGKQKKGKDDFVGVHLRDFPYLIIEAHSPFDRNVPGPYMFEGRPVQVVATASQLANPWQQYFSFKGVKK